MYTNRNVRVFRKNIYKTIMYVLTNITYRVSEYVQKIRQVNRNYKIIISTKIVLPMNKKHIKVNK